MGAEAGVGATSQRTRQYESRLAPTLIGVPSVVCDICGTERPVEDAGGWQRYVSLVWRHGAPEVRRETDLCSAVCTVAWLRWEDPT